MSRYDLALNKAGGSDHIVPNSSWKELPAEGFGTPGTLSSFVPLPPVGPVSVPNLREYRTWLRHFYQTDMAVVTYIDTLVHEAVALITRRPRGFTMSDLHHAAREFYLLGNTFMMPHPRGGWTFFDPNHIRVTPTPVYGSPTRYEFLQEERPGRRSLWIELPNLIHLARRRISYDTLGTPVIIVHMTEDGHIAIPQMDPAYHAADFAMAWDAWAERDNGIHFNNQEEVINGTNT